MTSRLPEHADGRGSTALHKTHEMRKERTAESGLEEWACPTCGRRILLRWPPHYTKHVLDAGDERACHIARTPDDTPTATETAAGVRWLRETAALARPAEPA
jgi:hypothetical protein